MTDDLYWPVSYREKEGVELLKLLYAHPETELAVDTEGTGLKVYDPVNGDYCIGVSLACVIDGVAYSHYYGIAHETGVNVSRETLDMLMYVLLQPRLLIFANVQYDIRSIETIDGTQLDNANFIDIQTMAHLADENNPFQGKSLENLAQFYLKEGKVVDPFVESEKVSGNHNITPEQMYEYARMDAVQTWRIWDAVAQHPEWQALPENIWPDKQDLIRTLIAMRRRGVRIDTGVAGAEIIKGEAEMKRLAAELGYPAKPTKRNPDPLPVLGPIALTEIFIDRLKLPVVKASKKTGKPSFDKDVMAEYDIMLERLDSPEAKLVKQYRGWQKAVSAAYRPYVERLDGDGRLRCSYKTFGTVTGRLSSSEPNLQQIPKESDKAWNGKVKECFIGDEGYTLINADFSQLELRLGTAYAGEEELKKVFAEGRDIFTEMSGSLEMSRDDTKKLVYTTQYGGGKNRLMVVFGVSENRAEEIRRNYFNSYPRFKMLADRCAASAERQGKVRIWTGRYRHFKYKSDSYKAMNSVIQGGAADIVERVMVQCFKKLNSEDCRMLLQVHDSITFEVKTELVEEYLPKIKAVMEDVAGAVGHNEFDVRFAVDVGFWSDREERRYKADMGIAA